MTRTLLAAVAAIALTPLGAQAQTLSTSNWSGMAYGTVSPHAPPAASTAQFWTDPTTGCSYARAQVGNYAPTWHLIHNGERIGLTNGRISCEGVIRPAR
ncbi:hypothetical protein [Histidinibacterium aquaticum]|uniref:Uncharacterized protein n=1 Tax=Histidinibacterium aquaticum TaxID=2613962 RepID=A0A5J5GEC1_9RHOB|nr:hypothetical protein [Histidinibacterium aquaticum]KAA9006132.1 hypothetical protein F3S47_16440 [Histidinibacterium aquaticum]